MMAAHLLSVDGSRCAWQGIMASLISAHRGECGVAGLPAAERYRRAIDLGVDFVELDVRRTRDGVLVNAHDPQTPSGRQISSLSHAEVRAELGDQLLSVDELLDVTGGKVGLHVDLKEAAYEAEIVRLIEPRSAGRVVFTGEDSSINAMKAHFPHLRAGLTLGDDLEGAPPWRKLRVRLSELFPDRRIRACNADFVAVHYRLARARVLADCASRGMQAWVWTVDEEADIAAFMADPRVAVLITNRPDIALRLRASSVRMEPR
jgi:glycerophosphoryl diester phosphodiesterase